MVGGLPLLQLRHALGLPNDRRRSYRNHYMAGVGGPTHSEWMSMIETGAAEMGCYGFAARNLFHLSRAGAEAALAHGETLDLEDFPDA